MIIILDFGSQYTRLICRRIRELGVNAEIVPCNKLKEKQLKKAQGIILSGSPASAGKRGSLVPDKKIFFCRVPILGICYGMQVMARLLKGSVAKSETREYGETKLKILNKDELFSRLPDHIKVWMSHYDRVVEVPPGFRILARTKNVSVAAMADRERKFYALQFHPEVAHTEYGKEILSNFLFKICKAKNDWNLTEWIENTIKEINRDVGKGKVLMALSGGVDSSVAAVLIQRAIGKRFYPVFVDHGLIREKDTERIENILIGKMGLSVKIVNKKDRFLRRLKGVKDPEKKRKIIGREFIKVFTEEAEKIQGITHLAQGTLYPDVVESAKVGAGSSKIKTHHNVGALPKRLKFKLLEPLRFLFKDEVRKVGKSLGIPREIIRQHPFPGPGLGVRILGVINKRKIDILSKADAIMEEEMKNAGVYYHLWQSFPVLLPVRTVGVMGDKRTYENVIALRCVESKDAMTANWARIPYSVLAGISTRLVNEIRGVNRVVYDLTNKPPGTIEWE